MSGYDDIIGLPHHRSPKRAPMAPLDRAAQFAPFAALTGYDDAVQEAARVTEPPRELDPDAIQELDRSLRWLRDHLSLHPHAAVTCFLPDPRKPGGAYVTRSGPVTGLREVEKVLILDGEAIPISSIIGLHLFVPE